MYVIPGIIIYTDCWRGYGDLNKYFTNFMVNHSKNFKVPITQIHTNTIKGPLAPLKRNVPIRWRTANKILLSPSLRMIEGNSFL